MQKKISHILINALPILLMIGLIPVIANDYILAGLYVVIIAISFFIKKERGELSIFLFGCVVMIACEALFVSTGVEVFLRNSLFGMMPIWLPLLWGYSFVAIKRAVIILTL